MPGKSVDVRAGVRTGDWIVVHQIGGGVPRRGEVIEVLGRPGHERYASGRTSSMSRSTSPARAPRSSAHADPQPGSAAPVALMRTIDQLGSSASTVAAQPIAADAAAQQQAAERRRQHEDEALNEALLESFPASDPPSSWAGP